MASATEQTPETLRLGGAVSFESFALDPSNQRFLGPPHPSNTVTPLALRLTEDSPNASLDSVVETIQSLQKDGTLTKHLARHGTLLFRGMPLRDATDFNKFGSAFGWKPMEMIGDFLRRPVLAPNVKPASFAPPESRFFSHNEAFGLPHSPGYIMFFNQKAPAKGGEQPIVSSLELFHRAQREMPEFIDTLAERGLMTKINYTWGVQFPGANTLYQSLGKEIVDGDDEATKRRKIEKQIARYNRGKYTTWEWTDEGVVVTHRLASIRIQPQTNLPSLFEGMAAFRQNARSSVKANSSRKGIFRAFYGDGSDIPVEYLDRLIEIREAIRVLHGWREGDVTVYDNNIAQHGREPWEGEQSDRNVMVSVWENDVLPGPYGFGEWAQTVRALDA